MRPLIFAAAVFFACAVATWATAGLESTLRQQQQINFNAAKIVATKVAIVTQTAVAKMTLTATATLTPGPKATATATFSPSPTAIK